MPNTSCKSLALIITSIITLSFLINLPTPVLAAGELFPTFLEIGKDGTLSREASYIRLTITNSNGEFISGVNIAVSNPSYCEETYWSWTVEERGEEYLIETSRLTEFAIRDNFVFTFSKSGFDTKIVPKELAINIQSIQIMDEYGSSTARSDLQFNMESIPPHLMIYNQLKIAFVDSSKYYVTQAKLWTIDGPFGYVVLDASFNIMLDEEICNKAFFASHMGQYFSQGFSTETLTQLSNWANDMISYGGSAYLLAEIRDLAASTAGWLIGRKLNFPQFPDRSVAEEIIADDQFQSKWLDYMAAGVIEWFGSDPPYPSYFEELVDIRDTFNFATAISRLKWAGEVFLDLSETIDDYQGTTYFEYNEVDLMYKKWVMSSYNMLTSSDLMANLIPHEDVVEQLDDILLAGVSGLTGFPVDTLVSEIQNLGCLLYTSICRLRQMEYDYYSWIQNLEISSSYIREAIAITGAYQVIIVAQGQIDDFTITAHHGDYGTDTTCPGGSITFAVSVITISGFPKGVTLSCSGQDATMTVSFSDNVKDSPFTSTLTIMTTAATYGSHILTITGTSGILSRTCQVSLIVTNENLQDFELVELETPVVFGSWSVVYGYFPDDWVHSNIDIDIMCNFGVDDNWWHWYDTALWENPNPTERDQFTAGLQPLGWLHASSTLQSLYNFEYPVTYRVKAGNHGTLGQQSNLIIFQVVKAPTSAELTASSTKIVEGDSISFNGRISSSYGVNPGDYWALKGTWSLEMRHDGSDWVEVFSDSIMAEYHYVSPLWGIDEAIIPPVWTPSAPGKYEFRLSYSGEYNYEPSISEIITVNVAPISYPISVTINGLPTTSATQVYIDNTPVDIQLGGSTETYLELDMYKTHILSVDTIIESELGTRYVATPFSYSVTESREYVFTYMKEYELTFESLPDIGGTISLTGINWLPEGSTVETIAEPADTYMFDHWILDNIDFGSDQHLKFIMNSKHSLKAVFTIATGPVHNLDFGPAGSNVESGYIEVTEYTVYSADMGYGWSNTAGLISRDRGAPDYLKRDLIQSTSEQVFNVDLANGDYTVTLVIGDQSYMHDNLDVYAEDILKINDLTATAGSFIEKTFGVTIYDGQLNLRILDDGGTDPNWVINSLTIEPGLPPPPPTEGLFDFGTSGSPVESGYTQVTESTLYSSTQGYGWSSIIGLSSRDRSAPDYLKRDLVQSTSEHNFNVDLANGDYQVTLVLGDQSYVHDLIDVCAEDVLRIDDLSITTGSFKEMTFYATVADGQLNLRILDDGGADGNWVINALTVQPGSPPPLPTEAFFDFGTGSSPVGEGYTQITESTLYSTGVGFGWSNTAGLSSRDRGVPGYLNRDLVQSATEHTFNVDLANGDYTVTITIGDQSYMHDNIDVYAEGTLEINDLTVAAGSFQQVAFGVSVADEQLNLGILDDGGTDLNWVITALTVEPGLPPPLPTEGAFDFGTDSSPLETDYTRVSSSSAYSSASGYGWSITSGLVSRDRGTPDSLKCDLVQSTTEHTFNVDLANGDYTITIIIGDQSYMHDNIDVYLEDTLKIDDLTVAAGSFEEVPFDIAVTDEQLNLRILDDGGADLNWVLNAITITSAA